MRVDMKVEFENDVIDFTVQYGKGKKMTLHMDPFGFFTLKAPKDTTVEEITAVIQSKGEWILDKKREFENNKSSLIDREYQDEGVFLYLGKKHYLHELIEVGNLDEEQLKQNLKKFYFEQCKKIVDERIKDYQQQLRVKPKVVEIVESKGKWGSCRSDKKLTFNYRLAMAPPEVIDYVIVHELCHLLHMNHDRSFWRKIGSIMPDYKEKEEYLARNGSLMTL
jgi:hypothetical protein